MRLKSNRYLYGKRVFWIALTAAFMAFIFFMSAQNGPQSSSFSGRVCRKIGEIFVPGFLRKPEAAQEAFVESISFGVRKAAHMTEYAVLTLLWRRTLGLFGKSGGGERKKTAAALLIAALYACTDEFHQSFVPGRGPSPVDVMIDTCGALIGLFLRRLFLAVRNT